MSEALELGNGFCWCIVVRKTGFHIADCGNEVFLPLQHNLNRKTVDTTRRFIIHCVIVERRSSGIGRGIRVYSKRLYRHGLRSRETPFWPLLEGRGP
jgi:hypothetical protein